jgi:5-formyltetrahydrofolate cyclo-ligase
MQGPEDLAPEDQGPEDLAAVKEAARKAAFARRKAAHLAGHPAPAAHLARLLAGHRGRPLAGYMAMRTEIDPTPAMAEAAAHGPVCVPVITGRGEPLRFRRWEPGTAMVEGGFGALIPAAGEWILPEILIVPLVAFSRAGGRLGYGGGFYDRTLEELRAAGGPVLAIGFAWAAQEASDLPLEATDQPLDLIVHADPVSGRCDGPGAGRAAVAERLPRLRATGGSISSWSTARTRRPARGCRPSMRRRCSRPAPMC